MLRVANNETFKVDEDLSKWYAEDSVPATIDPPTMQRVFEQVVDEKYQSAMPRTLDLMPTETFNALEAEYQKHFVHDGTKVYLLMGTREEPYLAAFKDYANGVERILDGHKKSVLGPAPTEAETLRYNNFREWIRLWLSDSFNPFPTPLLTKGVINGIVEIVSLMDSALIEVSNV